MLKDPKATNSKPKENQRSFEDEVDIAYSLEEISTQNGPPKENNKIMFNIIE